MTPSARKLRVVARTRALELVWTGSRKPSKVERAAIGRAARAGRLRTGDRVGPARGTFARVNPSPSSPAAQAYKDFHWGEAPRSTRTVRVAQPRELFVLGELRAVEYVASKGGEPARWHHSFKHPRPLLTATPSGRLGPLVGGRAHVTSRGIEG